MSAWLNLVHCHEWIELQKEGEGRVLLASCLYGQLLELPNIIVAGFPKKEASPKGAYNFTFILRDWSVLNDMDYKSYIIQCHILRFPHEKLNIQLNKEKFS